MSAPIGYVLDATEGEPHWFLGARVTYKTTSTQNGGGLFLAEFHAPRGHGAPLHVHTAADEMFYVLNGQLTVEFAGEQRTVTDGGFVFGPRNVEHRFRVDSEEAHFLLLTTPAGFEDFVRAAGEPASAPGLPAPTPPDIDRLMRAAAENGIQIIGPPLEDPPL
ncbi:MAG TPA: quercetin 2,3-dioxygenase [Sporichthyaceae bacterium]